MMFLMIMEQNVSGDNSLKYNISSCDTNESKLYLHYDKKNGSLDVLMIY